VALPPLKNKAEDCGRSMEAMTIPKMAKILTIHSMRRIWLDGRLYLANNIVGYLPSSVVRLALYRAMLGIKIGRGTNIFMRAWFDCPGGVEIGENTIVNQRCRLDGRGGLSIGNNVSIAADVNMITASHDMQSKDCKGTNAAITVHDYVFIGTRAMILPGVTLGNGSVVGAGAVVTKNVAPYDIVAGVPARVIGHRSHDLEYIASYWRLFH
jgi:acetyltransferase-like isoleucine patch superfamily enzyme